MHNMLNIGGAAIARGLLYLLIVTRTGMSPHLITEF